jgi:hypothetical protein
MQKLLFKLYFNFCMAVVNNSVGDFCAVRHNMLVENDTQHLATRPLPVGNPHSVPYGTGGSVLCILFSTNILSLTGQGNAYLGINTAGRRPAVKEAEATLSPLATVS